MMVRCCAALMEEHKHLMGAKGVLLATAGGALTDWYDMISSEQRRMPVASQIELLARMKTHVACYRDAGCRLVHKHHAVFHLCLSARGAGNPAFYSTYEDEHENGVCARVAENVHGGRFHMSLYERLEILERAWT